MSDITIKRSEYRRLLKSEAELEFLEAWGVDNWSGYNEAFGEDQYGNGTFDQVCAAIDEDYKD